MNVCGIDFSSHAVDLVLLDETTEAATWHRFELRGADAFDRARDVRPAVPGGAFWDDVIAVGIEDPRGYNAGALYRVQGAILAQIPVDKLVQPWIPSAWRKTVGLPGNASKDAIGLYVWERVTAAEVWPQDACDAYCIALATRTLLQVGAAA